MAIIDSIQAFYEYLLDHDKDNKLNWKLHKNGMCNATSRNPDECISFWICIKKNIVEILLLLEAKTPYDAQVYLPDVTNYINENNIDLVRMDSTVDNTKFRSKRRFRWVVSKEWTESPIECFDWAIKEYYKYVKLFKNI